ncbi:hypothetical protein BC936DRAFT_148768 [Jimgerdemannia flammicorona]|uniref:Uncharacterized protein n=1 Tax=Jimgerdemannia flammicorona TaxID=994334 RepID=A0A433DKD2_9FUNG|nr:hypothetical protein BC936DRAFT_148768 [Jimgerdemannia flammicorona]
MTTAQISAEVGEELAMEIASVRDNNPVVWTSTLEKYIDNALQKNVTDFKQAVLSQSPNVEDESFRLYTRRFFSTCRFTVNIYQSYQRIPTKILTATSPLKISFNLVDIRLTMSRKVGERKYIIYNVASLFKPRLRTPARAAKMARSSTNSGIMHVDAKATTALTYGI